MITGHLRLMVMKALSKRELSGYDIKRYIEKETGTWKPSFGSIYPLLEKLLKEGLVEFEASGRKKMYFLTRKGKASLPGIEKAKDAMADHMMSTINSFGRLVDDKDRSFMIEIFSSMKKGQIPFRELNPELNNFRATVFDAYSRNKDCQKIKAALREAARKIKMIR